MTNRLWAVEIYSLGKWSVWSAEETYKDARVEKKRWKIIIPGDKFRVTKYEAVR